MNVGIIYSYNLLVVSPWVFVFFFKQKTAYEMRISDWSSDVCSSDLADCGYQRLNVENHVFRIGRLHRYAIQACFQLEATGARRQLVGRDQPRAERARAIEIFAHRPLRLLELVFAHTAVVEYRIAQEVAQGVFPGYVFTRLTANDRHIA